MIENLGDLKKLLRLCRSHGVTEIEFGSVKLKLGDLPVDQPKGMEDEASFPDGELTPEQLAFYSSGGLPGEDPFRADQ